MKNRSRPIDETLDSGTRQVVLRVAERLMQASIDEIVSYADLNEVAECDIRTTDRWIVLQAIKQTNRTHGGVFANERKVGYRRLSSEVGVKYAGERGLKRVRSAAHNGREVLENAVGHANDLSPSQQRNANQRLAVFGLVDHLTKAKIVKTMPDEPPEKEDSMAALRKALGV